MTRMVGWCRPQCSRCGSVRVGASVEERTAVHPGSGLEWTDAFPFLHLDREAEIREAFQLDSIRSVKSSEPKTTSRLDRLRYNLVPMANGLFRGRVGQAEKSLSVSVLKWLIKPIFAGGCSTH